jgi:DNA-directed RNA polymerase specialized sigma24 family protein
MASNEIGSVTDWLGQLRNGNPSAAQQAIWKRYFRRLTAVARGKLPPAARRAADEEDIALSTLGSFFNATEQGRYPDLRDRTELWPLLVRIATCKAANQAEREFAAKRGGGKVRGDSAMGQRPANQENRGFDMLIGPDPTPDSVVEMNQLVADLFERLDSGMLRDVARLRLSGHSNREIATRLDVSERTIERKLLRIRRLWLSLSECAG